jgi:predicted ATP-binding protein involved in virulence
MFLQSIHLEQVRSLSDVEFDFRIEDERTRKWTLLLGENGCGKSTVLRAIALLLAGEDALPELLGTPDSWIRNNATSCKMSARLVTKKKETRDISLSFSRGQSISQILKDNSSDLEQLNDALEYPQSNYPTIGYGASRRLTTGKSSRHSSENFFNAPRASAVATLFSSDASLNALESWAINMHYREGEQGLKLVKDTLTQLLPGLCFNSIERQAGTLLFDTPDGPVPLHQLSDGYQNMAGWCGDLLYRLVTTFRHRNRPLESRGLLLVDEIDLHLHPVWQRQLRKFLSEKFKNLQIIATTHSPLTAQQAGEGEIFVLHRESDPPRVNVTHWDGTASLLTTQQVITSPAFGLESTLSHEMQDARNEWKTRQSPSARKKLSQLKRHTLIPPDSKTTNLLKVIERELASRRPSSVAKGKTRKP